MNYVKEKQTIKKMIMVEKEVEINIINWDEVPSGTYVECKINGRDVKGVYVLESDKPYILHTDRENSGNKPRQKYGYPYGWSFDPEGVNSGHSDVTDVVFPEPPSNFKLVEDGEPLFIAGYEAKIFKNNIMLGCQTVTRKEVEKVLELMNKAEIE